MRFTSLSPLTPSHYTVNYFSTVLYPSKFFLLRLQINVTTYHWSKLPFPAPNCSPLSSLATTTPFLFFEKTTNVQDDTSSRASFFPSVPSSFQTKIENPNLHWSVPPLLPLQKNPIDLCWERSTSERPVSTCLTLVNFV